MIRFGPNNFSAVVEAGTKMAMETEATHFGEDRRPLVLLDLCVGVNSDDEVVAHQLGLSKGVGVADVDHVVAPVAPNSDL